MLWRQEPVRSRKRNLKIGRNMQIFALHPSEMLHFCFKKNLENVSSKKCILIKWSKNELQTKFWLLSVEAVAWRYSVTKVFLKISKSSQENTYVSVNKVAGLHPTALPKKRFQKKSECCKILKNTYFCRKPPVAASCP